MIHLWGRLSSRGELNKDIWEIGQTCSRIMEIEEETKIGVTVPEFGETYELNEKVEMTHKIERKVANTLRNEIIGRLNRLKEEVKDMENYVIQDVDDKNLRDEDIFRINEKIKDLEKQIINVIEG